MRGFFDLICVLYHFYRARKLMCLFNTREELEAWQLKKIERMRRTTFLRSAFYCQYAQVPMIEIPIMCKKDMVDNFDEINTVGIYFTQANAVARKAEENRSFSPTINNITVGLSSGTSGKQSVFLVSKSERLRWAGIMLAKALPEKITDFHRIAFFLRANSNLYNTLSKGKRIQFNFFDLTQDFTKNIVMLDKFQPTVLTAPASVLRKIAEAQRGGYINIDPKKIISVAEVLTPEDEKYLQEIFQIQHIHQIYQCTEGFLGITRNNGRLYLNEEYLHVEQEWIDRESGRFIPIITDFTRTTQPIIRYRLDDILVEDMTDTSPFTCLKSIEGRCDDLFYLKNVEGNLKPLFSDPLRQRIIQCDLNFTEYRLIQKSLGHIEVQVTPALQKHEEKILIDDIYSLCEQQLLMRPEVTFAPYEEQPLHQKLRRLQRTFELSTDGKECI